MLAQMGIRRPGGWQCLPLRKAPTLFELWLWPRKPAKARIIERDGLPASRVCSRRAVQRHDGHGSESCRIGPCRRTVANSPRNWGLVATGSRRKPYRESIQPTNPQTPQCLMSIAGEKLQRSAAEMDRDVVGETKCPFGSRVWRWWRTCSDRLWRFFQETACRFPKLFQKRVFFLAS